MIELLLKKFEKSLAKDYPDYTFFITEEMQEEDFMWNIWDNCIKQQKLYYKFEFLYYETKNSGRFRAIYSTNIGYSKKDTGIRY